MTVRSDRGSAGAESPERARDRAMSRVRRVTALIGVSAAAGALGLGLLVASDTASHSSSAAVRHISSTGDQVTASTSTATSSSTTGSTTATTPATTTTTEPTTTTTAPTTTSAKATTTSGQS